MTEAIRFEHVTRTLTEEAVPVTLVQDISFTINRGEFVSVVGPSGSGKSSLMYLIGLLDQPTGGKITIDGVDAVRADNRQKERIRLEKIGFVFQFHFLLQEFTVAENILLPMRKRGKLSPAAMKRRAADLLEEFGLGGADKKRPAQLSGGERQRVAIARALANDPLILLADEPTGNLDTKNADVVFSLFERLSRTEGRTIVTITHDPDLAARAHRQLHLLDSRLVAG